MSATPARTNNLSWMIGGAQGSGVDSSANIFSRACVHAGLWVYGTREYYSNIKGLHSYFEVRVSDKQIRSKIDDVDLLATFDAETLIRHAEAVRPRGGIIYNPSLAPTEIQKVDTIENNIREKIAGRLAAQGLPANVSGIIDEAQKREIQIFPVPYEQIINQTGTKIGEKQFSKLSRIINVLAVSASMAVLGLDVKYVEQAVEAIFGGKKKIIEMNVVGAGLVYDMMKSIAHPPFSAKLAPIEKSRPRMFVAGNQAVALGKIVGGCRMQAYYPITPASDESEFLESNENFSSIDGDTPDGKGSTVVVQTEDEIAAITMATGAALTGTRASTSTSGPGFSLMVEGMGWAGINEVPVVITLYSRGGPATGLPTRNEQGDLQFVLHASHGEFPRIVLSSGDMEECFYDAIRIFNYAERYQCPAVHMVDKALANSNMTILPLSSEEVPIERGKMIIDGSAAPAGGEPYKRFKFTEDGISPRAVLGLKGYRFWNTGDEHS
ncbi:MAG: 2-oxoacid:acceptor oxidoreductase family protein, partial [Nitrososphaerales archaeon]